MNAMNETTPRRVVVVGAGPGGLASAMLLRAAGLEVTVLERADRVGGRTASFTQDGFTFDYGPTFYLYPQVLREIFGACGYDLDAEVDLRRLDPMYRLQFDDGRTFDATADIDRLTAEAARLSPEDAPNVRRYLETNAAKFDSFVPILQRPFLGLGDLLRRDMWRALPNLRPWSSVDTDLKRWFKDRDLRLAFSFQSKYLGMSPFKCPSLFTIIAHSSTATACSTRSAAATRSPAPWPGSRPDGRGHPPVGAGRGDRLRGPPRDLRPHAAGTIPADAIVVNGDFATTIAEAHPRRAAPPLDRREDRLDALFLLDLHAVPRR